MAFSTKGDQVCFRIITEGPSPFHVVDIEILAAAANLSGYLLGLGSEPIPEAFPHGKMIPAFVILYDQLGRAFRVGVKLRTDRHLHAPLRRGLVRRQGGLLDKRDVIPGG